MVSKKKYELICFWILLIWGRQESEDRDWVWGASYASWNSAIF